MKDKIFTVSMDDYQESGNGICLRCGEIQFGGCEPDARHYECEVCGARNVFGMEEALLMGNIIVQTESTALPGDDLAEPDEDAGLSTNNQRME